MKRAILIALPLLAASEFVPRFEEPDFDCEDWSFEAAGGIWSRYINTFIARQLCTPQITTAMGKLIFGQNLVHCTCTYVGKNENCAHFQFQHELYTGLPENQLLCSQDGSS